MAGRVARHFCVSCILKGEPVGVIGDLTGLSLKRAVLRTTDAKVGVLSLKRTVLRTVRGC